MRLVYNNFKLLMEDMVRDALPGYQVYCKTMPSKDIMNGALMHIDAFPQFVDVLFINNGKEYGVAIIMQNLYEIYRSSSNIEEVIQTVKKTVYETIENQESFIQKAAEKKMPREIKFDIPQADDKAVKQEQKNSYSLGLDIAAKTSKKDDMTECTAAPADAASAPDAFYLKICQTAPDKNDIYRKFFDMYIVYCNESGNITKAMLNASKMSEEELYNMTAENSAKKHPITFTEIEQDKYLLTTQNVTNGAAAMLYPGALKKISEELDDDLYLAPVSDKFVFVWKKNGKKNVKEEMQKYYDMMEKLYGLSKFSEYILHYHKDSGILTPLDGLAYKI